MFKHIVNGMKKTSFALLIIACIITSACTRKSDAYRQLVQIDTLLLEHNMDDTAVVLLRLVVLKTEEGTAYYNILESAAEYDQNWKIKNIDPLNYSIDYYSTHPDNLKLANAFYYKALYYMTSDIYTEDVVVLLKTAEQLAKNTNNLRLTNRIYATISIINTIRGEFDEALRYSDKECATAKKLRDNYCVAYALMARSMIYKAIQRNDSSEYYIMQCKSLADNLENDDKAFLYNYLGECFMYENQAAAKKYFFDALEYSKLPDTYANIAKVYYNENKNELAELYCDSALVNASYAVKKDIQTLMSEKSYESRDIDKYKHANDELLKTLNLKIERIEQSHVLEVQKKYDFEKQRTDYQRKQWLLYTALCSLIGLCFIGLVLHQLRLQKIRNRELQLENKNSMLYNEIADLNRKIGNCKEQIDVLNRENQRLTEQNNSTKISTNDVKIGQLNAQLSDLSNQLLVYMENGQKIYQLIVQNESIARYNKQWADCAYYFCAKNPEQDYIFDKYKNLTINDKIFIIAEQFLNKTDDEIARILSVSVVTVRTHRFKLKSKLL